MNLKHIYLSAIMIAGLLLTGCVTPPDNKITLSPQIALPNQDVTISGTSINVVSFDKRENTVLAKIERKGQLVELTANRDVRFLLQEIVEKQMSARGYAVGGNAPVTIQVVLNKLHADVTEGNLRHRIDAVVELTLLTGSINSQTQYNKTYRAQYSIEGPLTVSQAKIQEVLNTVLTNAVNEMAQDHSVSQFIRQNH